MKSVKTNRSLKNAVSAAMGSLLVAAIYANAVYVPQHDKDLSRDLHHELAGLKSGAQVMVPASDGYVVRERLTPSVAQTVSSDSNDSQNIDRLVAEIAVLEEKLEGNKASASTSAPGPAIAAYVTENVERVAQTDFQKLSRAARQIASISGLPIGATIGSLASIVNDPLFRAGALEVISASAQPGGVSAAVSNGGGLSASAVAVLTLLGVNTVGTAGGVNSAGASDTSVAPSSP